MKKILITLSLLAALEANAATHLIQSFFPAGVVAQALAPNAFTNGITNLYTSPATNSWELLYGNNTPSTYGNFSTFWCDTSNSVSTTTVIGGASSSNTFIQVGTVIFAAQPAIYNVLGTNMFFFVLTNSASYGTNGITNTTVGPYADVHLYADANGNVNTNCNIQVSVCGDTAKGSNIIYFNFAASGGNYIKQYYPQLQCGPDYNTTNALQYFSFGVTLNGTNQVVYTTNPPVSFLAGADTVRLISTVLTTNNGGGTIGTDDYINGITWNGWQP